MICWPSRMLDPKQHLCNSNVPEASREQLSVDGTMQYCLKVRVASPQKYMCSSTISQLTGKRITYYWFCLHLSPYSRPGAAQIRASQACYGERSFGSISDCECFDRCDDLWWSLFVEGCKCANHAYVLVVLVAIQDIPEHWICEFSFITIICKMILNSFSLIIACRRGCGCTRYDLTSHIILIFTEAL